MKNSVIKILFLAVGLCALKVSADDIIIQPGNSIQIRASSESTVRCEGSSNHCQLKGSSIYIDGVLFQNWSDTNSALEQFILMKKQGVCN